MKSIRKWKSYGMVAGWIAAGMAIAPSAGVTVSHPAIPVGVFHTKASTTSSIIDSPSVQDAVYGVSQLNLHTGVTAMQARGWTGRGIHIAVISYEPINGNDVLTFSKRLGLPTPVIHIIPVHGGASQGILRSAAGDVEAVLDIDAVHMVAPNAVVDVYEAPPTALISTVLQAIRSKHSDQIVTVSYGFHYFQLPASEETQEYQLVHHLNQMGVTVFAATGDTAGTTSNLTLNIPAILPNVVAVGGFEFLTGSKGYRARLTNWSRTSGGFTSDFPEPAYQNVVNRLPAIPTLAVSNRMIPDISGPADIRVGASRSLTEGFPVFATTSRGRTWYFVQGTSLAAPYVAAMFADIEQSLGHSLGDINPILYAVHGTTAFLPIADTMGGSAYRGGPTYNLVTGLGLPSPTFMQSFFEKYVQN